MLDRWINNNLASDYTRFLKDDVEYVTSYLQILFTKEILLELQKLSQYEPFKVAEYLSEKYNVEFDLEKTDITMEDIHKTLINYLYFLVDMHTNAKQRIKSPQAKLIDFMNRLKVNYEVDQDRAMPYSL